ncbi:MAG: penicillin-binding transpeptidase domain-containing protein [Solirubrobacteraceae bacterium]
MPLPPGRRRPPVSEVRRRRLVGRALPLAVIAAGAFAAGGLVGAAHEPHERVAAKRFLRAWTRGDYGAMYERLAASSRATVSARGFARAYRRAAQTATLERVELAGDLRERDGAYTAPMRAVTRSFGTLPGAVRFVVTSDADDVSGVRFAPRLVFPGLRDGETLRRSARMPPRADLQARDGAVIASGPERASQIGPAAAEIAGRVGPIPTEQAAAYAARGYPAGAVVGLSGLERQFEERLAGELGGSLRAGTRLLASAEPRQGGAVRTSIDGAIEAAAVAGLAGRLGGVAVLRPKTGEVLALAGLGYSAPQPPGSTFKIVTLAAALDAGAVQSRSSFPVQTEATLSGVKLANAHGEACGGSLETAFAESCNSVFAPLGAKVGAARLVAAAERFGFNETSEISGAPPGSIPPAAEIGDDLAVGSTAIGQGRVTSTPLRMAEVAGAIANRGALVRPAFLRGAQGRRSRATSRSTARTITRFMRSVVAGGTGSAAAIPGVAVAGKTGTAELRSTIPDPAATDPAAPDPADATDTDAWFVAFAPAGRPRVVVAVLLVGQGAGGGTAAPAAKTVIEAALR